MFLFINIDYRIGKTLELAGEYRMRTVQCLVTADYTKGAEFTIEVLILYNHGEYASKWDAEVGIWVIFGMTVRLAMRGGFHRDPKHFPAISPYHCKTQLFGKYGSTAKHLQLKCVDEFGPS